MNKRKKKKLGGKDDLQTLSETIDLYLCTDTLIFKKYANLAQPENGRSIFKAIIVSVRGFKALVSYRWFLYVHPKWGAAQSSDAEPSAPLSFAHTRYLLPSILSTRWFGKHWLLFSSCGSTNSSLGCWTWSVCTLDSVRASECLRLFEQTPLCLNVYQTALQIRLQINSLGLLAAAMAKCAQCGLLKERQFLHNGLLIKFCNYYVQSKTIKLLILD